MSLSTYTNNQPCFLTLDIFETKTTACPMSDGFVYNQCTVSMCRLSVYDFHHSTLRQ